MFLCCTILGLIKLVEMIDETNKLQRNARDNKQHCISCAKYNLQDSANFSNKIHTNMMNVGIMWKQAWLLR